MPSHPRIVFLGGGSITWTLVFTRDLCESQSFDGGTLVLMDIDKKANDAMKAFCEKAFAEKGKKVTIETTTDLYGSLDGADIVVNSVLVGGHVTWKQELDIIERYGLQHPKGMSVGPGGMIMGLKQTQFIVKIAQEMEKRCPNAWLFNFSNPMQVLTLGYQRYSKIKSIGLCHGLRHSIRLWSNRLGIPLDEIHFKAGGVNHFEFVTELTHKGRNLFPDLLASFKASEAKGEYTGEHLTLEMFELFGAWPCNFDIHTIEYMPWFIRKGVDVKQFHQEQNSIDNRLKDRDKRWGELQDFMNGKKTLKELVPDKHSEHLHDLVDAVVLNRAYVFYANIMNNGCIRNLPDSCVVEVPVVIDQGGWMGCNVGPLPQGVAEISALHAAVQDAVVEAAMTGSRDLCVKALSMDPMCFSLSLDERRKLVDELLNVNKAYLEKFF